MNLDMDGLGRNMKIIFINVESGKIILWLHFSRMNLEVWVWRVHWVGKFLDPSRVEHGWIIAMAPR